MAYLLELVEVNGDTTPYGVQHLLGRARWDAEAVWDELRAYLVEHLGDLQAVLVLEKPRYTDCMYIDFSPQTFGWSVW